MDISLDGGEITIIKALGLSGGDVPGEVLIQRAVGMDTAELVDALQGLIMLGYVVSDLEGVQSSDDLKKGKFHVNSGYGKQLKEAMNPTPDKKPKRVRRE